MKAHFCIQCTCPKSGVVGDFLKVGVERISPIFPSVMDLAMWCSDNGWKAEEPHSLNSLYVKKS